MLIRSIFLTTALMVGGCASITGQISNEEAPLHVTLNGLKSEIRTFQKALIDSPESYQLKCGNTTYPNEVKFQSIVVELATSTSSTSEANGGVEKIVKIGGKGSRVGSRADTLTLNITPKDDGQYSGSNSYFRGTGKPTEGGIAEALLALMGELNKVDDREPCFEIKDGDGTAATLKLAFGVEKVKEVEGGIDIAVFKVGAKSTKNSAYSNTVTVKVAIPDGATLLAPNNL